MNTELTQMKSFVLRVPKNQEALQLFFQKLVEIKIDATLSIKNLLLLLTSAVKIFHDAPFFEFGFFVSKNYWIFGVKTKNVQNDIFHKIYEKSNLGSFINSFSQLLTPKKVMVYHHTNLCKIVWFGIFLLVCPR